MKSTIWKYLYSFKTYNQKNQCGGQLYITMPTYGVSPLTAWEMTCIGMECWLPVPGDANPNESIACNKYMQKNNMLNTRWMQTGTPLFVLKRSFLFLLVHVN